MKVLFLGNTAGVMSPIAKWLNENGHEAKICDRYEQDEHGWTRDLEGAVLVDTPFDYFKMSLKLIRSFKPDVIHLSSSAKLLILARWFVMRTPIIYVHHGPGKRNFIGIYDVAAKLADFVQLSTPDIKVDGVWLDRLIREYFYDRGGRKKNTALMMYRNSFYVDYREEAKEWAKKHGVELTIFNQSKGDFVLHNDMPEFLSKFEFFLDWKGMSVEAGRGITVSTAAMEASLCGCKIIHDSDMNSILENIKIPTPEDYYELYERLEKPSRRLALSRIPSIIKGSILWFKQGLIKKWKR